MQTQILHTAKIYIIFKKSSKRNHNGSRYYYNSSITNLKIRYKPKKISSFKNSHIKIDLLLLLLPRGYNVHMGPNATTLYFVQVHIRHLWITLHQRSFKSYVVQHLQLMMPKPPIPLPTSKLVSTTPLSTFVRS
jgi:hypothetical protein